MLEVVIEIDHLPGLIFLCMTDRPVATPTGPIRSSKLSYRHPEVTLTMDKVLVRNIWSDITPGSCSLKQSFPDKEARL
jgi:hypothetical protein